MILLPSPATRNGTRRSFHLLGFSFHTSSRTSRNLFPLTLSSSSLCSGCRSLKSKTVLVADSRIALVNLKIFRDTIPRSYVKMSFDIWVIVDLLSKCCLGNSPQANYGKYLNTTSIILIKRHIYYTIRNFPSVRDLP